MRRGLRGAWSELTAPGKRRVGEFVANMFLGVAASGATLVVIPSLTGSAAIAEFGVVGGVLMTLTFAIFAVLVRIATEERKGESAKETAS